ncbi:class I SAM-dependent methyltransferase [Micromonospora sp. NPDC005174]|uniref:class I SAM-dependent methyltransferase n=1 Tax=Micromonospora sp. NPDC005174 TaxID=3157018 RepID=UPI0033BFB3C8
MTASWHEQIFLNQAVKRLESGVDRPPMFAALMIPDDEPSQADERYHDGEADRYDSYSQTPRIAVAERWILSWISRTVPNGVIVDLGCGTGRIAHELASVERRVIAIDRSQQMLAQASATLPADSTALLRCDARMVPVADGSVDAVVCSGVLHHIPDWPDAIREMSRILRPGGTMIVREPNAEYPEALFAPVERAIESVVRTASRRRHPAQASEPDQFQPSPVEQPIVLAEVSKRAADYGLKPTWEGSAKFFGSLGIPDAVPLQRMYFEIANLVDRAILHSIGLRHGSLAIGVYAKSF